MERKSSTLVSEFQDQTLYSKYFTRLVSWVIDTSGIQLHPVYLRLTLIPQLKLTQFVRIPI